MDKLLIVDGSNLLFQMFYGMPARIINHQGKAIQGTLGFIGALLKIIRMVQPSHVAVFFDGACENNRSALDANYKANRPDYSQIPEEDTPFSQLPDIYKALAALQIAHAETYDCEADDWIAGYALACGTESDVVIASQDSDFFQLISDRVRILRYRGKNTVLCDRTWLMEKYSIHPEQYADFKSLTGDNADNIKGADKIGPKTAAQLLNQFGTLENLLNNIDSVTKPSIRESLRRNAARLRTNDCLIRLNANASLPFEPDVLLFHDRGLTTTEVLKSIGLR